MKKLLYILLFSAMPLVAGKLCANDIDDILRSLESPEVDYNIDENIKAIPPSQPPPIEPIPNIIYLNQSYKPKSEAKKDIREESKYLATASSSHYIKKTQSDSIEKKIAISSSSKIIEKKPDTEALIKEKLAENAKKQVIKVEIETEEKTKPIQLYNLYVFFSKIPFITTWKSEIDENLAFGRLLANYLITLKPESKIKDKEEEEKNEEDSSNEIENEEEYEKTSDNIDDSKHKEILAQAKKLYDKGKWAEIKDLFNESEGASDSLEAQKYLLAAELHEPKPNVNSLRRSASEILSEKPEDPEANYAMAYYHFYSKRQNKKKASEYIAKALKSKNPPKGAIELANAIKGGGLWAIITIFLIIAAILSVILTKKIKRKKLNESLNAIEELQGKTLENKENEESQEKLCEEIAEEKTEEINKESYLEENPERLEKVEELGESVIEYKEKIIDEIKGPAKQIEEKIIDEIKEPIQQNEEKLIDETKKALQEIKEEADQEAEEEIIEEIIEEIEEEPEPEAEEEIIEEIIEEIEEEPEPEVEEEIIEEIIEEEEVNATY